MLLPHVPRPLVMGIVNVTPDSFSGDGLLHAADYVAASVRQAQQMLDDGAHILDVGGESSRPGAEPVSAAEEIRRVVPVIEALIKSGIAAPIAVDTIKAEVAEAALQAGATIINDISALQADARMASLVARFGAHVVLMHNASRADAVRRDATVGGEYKGAIEGDSVEVVRQDMARAADRAMQAGIAADKIMLDPGIGFGKTLEQNLALVNRADDLKRLGYPVLAGPSRKSFIGRALDLPVDSRLEGTAACVAIAALRGVDIIRVHDVQFMARVAKMAKLVAGG